MNLLAPSSEPEERFHDKLLLPNSNRDAAGPRCHPLGRPAEYQPRQRQDQGSRFRRKNILK